MSLRQPRRIFRSSGRHVSGRGLGMPAQLGLGVAAVGAAVALLSIPTDLFGRGSGTGAVLTADAPAVAVVDGETLRLRESVLRLDGINAPARGQRCATSPKLDCGAAAATALAALVRGQGVECRVVGRVGGVPHARCRAHGTDLGEALVRQGWARAVPGAAGLAAAEEAARRAGLGLWQGT